MRLSKTVGGQLSAMSPTRDSQGARCVKRPGLLEALNMLDAGEADVLVCASLSRLARSVVDLGNMMAKAEKAGWDLIVLDFGVDTTTPSGRLVMNVMASVSQFESGIIGERAAMTHKQRKAQAKRAGQNPILDDAIRHRVAAMRAAGGTQQGIADILNAKKVPTANGAAGIAPR